MQRQLVASSNLRSVGYDPSSRTLEVEFFDWRVYQYFEVPQTICAALLSAGSKGSYLEHMIAGRYPYQRIH